MAPAARFHGHLGPWLVLGLRAGGRCRRLLGTDPFRLRATVHAPRRTPYTCLIDGIQFSSGCTLGKGNIRCLPSSRVWVEFQLLAPDRTGRVISSLRLELRPELWTELHLKPLRTRAAMAAMARRLHRRAFSRLFLETKSP